MRKKIVFDTFEQVRRAMVSAGFTPPHRPLVAAGLNLIVAAISLMVMLGIFVSGALGFALVLLSIPRAFGLLDPPGVLAAVRTIAYLLNLICTILSCVITLKLYRRGIIDVEAIVLSVGFATAFIVIAVWRV